MNYSQKSPNLARKYATICFLIFIVSSLYSQNIVYNDALAPQGITLSSANAGRVELNFSIVNWSMNENNIEGELAYNVQLPGVFLPNNAGAPDLPGLSRYIAIPNGADARIKILYSRTEIIENVNIAPAPVIPAVPEDGELKYAKDLSIYNANKYYPREIAVVSPQMAIRGVNAVIVGVTPFQYNPVSKQLIVYRDLQIEVTFNGGTGYFGEDRLRSRYFEPVLSSMFINYESIPQVDLNKKSNTRGQDYEYLIISPDSPEFLAWADSIKQFRTEQGILTGIVTTTEIGGNTTSAIENYINNAYNNWSVPPVAVMLLADFGTSGNTIVSPSLPHPYSGTYISDNVYADVDGDELPDITFARITARNEGELETMINKFLEYERNPPTSSDFYKKPIAAGGWQTERWFILADEVIYGFWENALNKEPVREYAIYSGSPGSVWSTNQNTGIVVDYFGPNGLGYIPATPSHLTDWGGNASRINNDINAGSFMLLHRDHGLETGWGEPDYGTGDIGGINNEDLTFFLSINCLTGKFDWSGESFAEKFHRHPKAVLGMIAATEVSYSFVNDTYIWGLFDYMWPEFDPGHGESGDVNVLPAFANVSGKYFLEASSWPYNTGDKVVTYNLFHMHGDAFSRVYSEVPQHLTVNHNPVHTTGVPSFSVQADEGAFIAITHNGEILGTAESTGGTMDIDIPFVTAGEYLTVTVTKQNYYRYSTKVQVIPAEGPYIVKHTIAVDDALANNNGLLDYGETVVIDMSVKNVGLDAATDVTVTIRTTDEYVTLIDSTEFYGNIPAEDTLFVDNGFSFSVANDVPDGHQVSFQVVATNGTDIWSSNFSIQAHAPILQFLGFEVNDQTGNNNGKLDPGETATINITLKNKGTSGAMDVSADLGADNNDIVISNSPQAYGEITAGATVEKAFTVTVGTTIPQGHIVNFSLDITAAQDILATGAFYAVVGQFPVLIIDLDENHNSGPAMLEAFEANSLPAEYMTGFPDDLSIYTSIFVCLGIYSNNAVLSSSQGQKLADFLNMGGMLYMEGGDTWYYDTATPVHAMFNINGVSDGSGDLGTINGESSTLTEGMSFSYAGDNSWVDHISATGDAYEIFTNQSPSYGCAVANETNTYKTIGSSFEFGGLTDGSYPSTKEELMKRYIEFFEILGGSNDTTICRELNVDAGWNIISAPTEANDMSVTGCFPEAASPAYGFNELYVLAENLECGKGYWLKFNAPETVTFCGSPGMTEVPVMEGWNMVGMFHENVEVANLQSDPAGIISSEFFGFNNGYSPVSQLNYGKGYWVKMSAAGTIWVNDAKAAKLQSKVIPESWGKIVISDISGNSATLYSSDKSDGSVFTEMPPMPPVGVFDVRFSSNKFAEVLSGTGKKINISGAVFPVKIHASGTDLSVYNPISGESYLVLDGNEILIADENIKSLEVSTAEIPDDYSLYQNYPNPFNPKTTIRVAIPELSKVTLKIYDVVGREVETLVNKELEPGYYNFAWNASSYASGVYIYRVIAGDFVQTKKLVLLK